MLVPLVSCRRCCRRAPKLNVSFAPPPQAFVRIGGVASAVAGLALIIAGQQSLGNSLSPFPEPRRDEHALITDGAFSYVRHPM